MRTEKEIRKKLRETINIIHWMDEKIGQHPTDLTLMREALEWVLADKDPEEKVK